jgi:hypothetical protein
VSPELNDVVVNSSNDDADTLRGHVVKVTPLDAVVLWECDRSQVPYGLIDIDWDGVLGHDDGGYWL